jgi:probable rRNA maturation factor
MKNPVSVFASRRKYGEIALSLGKLGRKLPAILGKRGMGFEVHLVSDPEMKALNRRFRSKNRPTNVLSFEAGSVPARPDLGKNVRYLGEIFLAPDHIRVKRENPNFLLIHGFLHLLGYTHKSRRDRIKMEKVEEKLCRRLKIRSIYV